MGMENVVEVVTDADWQGCQETRKSSSGWSLYWGGVHLQSGSGTQPGLPALSSCESEYRASARGVIEAVLLRKLEAEVGFKPEHMTAWTDSTANRALCQRLGPGKVKHMPAGALYLQEMVKNGGLRMAKVATAENSADLLTKHLLKDAVAKHRQGLGLLQAGEVTI